MESYLTEKEAQGARSIHNMKSAWKAARPTFESLDPHQIDRELCRRYAKMRRKTVSDGTIIKELTVVRSALRYHKVPGPVFELPSAPPPRDTYITRPEVQTLIDAATHHHLKLFIVLAWSTAARASALFELTWDRIDFERGQIRLSGAKGRRKGRAIVPMTGQARKALEEAYIGRTSDFVIEWAGKSVKSVKRGFEAAVRNAGLQGTVTPHVLRHSAAVRMAEAGISIPEIAQYLGHTDPRVTFRVYSRYSPDHLRNAAEALE